MFLPKMFNLVLLIAMLSVVVACITWTSLCSGVVSAACVSVAVRAHFQWSFWLQSWLVANFVTVV